MAFSLDDRQPQLTYDKTVKFTATAHARENFNKKNGFQNEWKTSHFQLSLINYQNWSIKQWNPDENSS